MVVAPEQPTVVQLVGRTALASIVTVSAAWYALALIGLGIGLLRSEPLPRVAELALVGIEFAIVVPVMMAVFSVATFPVALAFFALARPRPPLALATAWGLAYGVLFALMSVLVAEVEELRNLVLYGRWWAPLGVPLAMFIATLPIAATAVHLRHRKMSRPGTQGVRLGVEAQVGKIRRRSRVLAKRV